MTFNVGVMIGTGTGRMVSIHPPCSQFPKLTDLNRRDAEARRKSWRPTFQIDNLLPMNYWLDLFTGTTWEESQKAGASVSGFTHRMRKTVQSMRGPDSRVSLC